MKTRFDGITTGGWGLDERFNVVPNKGGFLHMVSPWIENAWDDEIESGDMEIRKNMALIAASPDLLALLIKWYETTLVGCLDGQVKWDLLRETESILGIEGG